MGTSRFIVKIFLSFLLITIIGLSVITWYSTNIARKFYLQETIGKLSTEANLISHALENNLIEIDSRQILTDVTNLSRDIDTRITIILSDGKVIADNFRDPQEMDNHLSRPEVMRALQGMSGVSNRFSKTLSVPMVYFAKPLQKDNKTIAIVRTALPINSIDETLSSIRFNIILAGIIISLITAGVGFFISRQISAPLEEMTAAISQYTQGNFTYKISRRKLSDFSAMAAALEEMGHQLNDKIQMIDQQKNQLQSVLYSMAEGVLAFDREQRLIRINKAARNLLGLKKADTLNKQFQELSVDKSLKKIIKKSFSTTELVEDEIILSKRGDRFVQVHGNQLNSPDGRVFGVLVVLNDVTRLRRLERVRRDFVANVSHEIRTPLTSIKGFVEALNDGALKDEQTANRFLDIIQRQANRLELIIKDLLDLASLEENEERSAIQFESASLSMVISEALQICQLAAKEKNIRLAVNCPAQVTCSMNTSLIEQALVNLIGNAVKYSPENTTIEINYELTDKGHIIEVKDQGIGIAKDHIPRIFERFYRVDKARSRKLGGTGLGLAIVKHIARVHGGEVTVFSEFNKGSSFKIHLPA